jgi:hypothetical protein
MSAEAAAVTAAVGFLALAAFQVALALGAPWGRAAWGGAHEGRLPTRLRISSAVAAAFWVLASIVILGRAGFEVVSLPPGLVRWGTWALVVLLPIGGVMNLASRSRWERFLWGPVAVILAALCLVVARSPLPSGG